MPKRDDNKPAETLVDVFRRVFDEETDALSGERF